MGRVGEGEGLCWLCGLGRCTVGSGRRLGFAGRLDDLHDILLFIDKLLVVLVVVEVGQEGDQTFAILAQNILNLRRFLGVSDKHLEYVECFKLDVFALVAEKVHHHFEVVFGRDVFGHNGEIGSIEEDLAEEFEGLSFGDVVGRLKQGGVHGEERVVVAFEESGDHRLMTGQHLFEIAECIARDAECRLLDIVGKSVEVGTVQQNLGQRLVSKHFL